MNTRTLRQRTPKPAPAQFSTAAAKLIEQLQADARTQLLADLSAKDAIVVLHGLDAETKRVRIDGTSITICDGKGNRIDLFQRHVEPECWRGKDYMAGVWHPAHWEGTKDFVDANGTKWNSSLPTMVCDDFGNLVQVAE